MGFGFLFCVLEGIDMAGFVEFGSNQWVFRDKTGNHFKS
jgi:hypothetical protein